MRWYRCTVVAEGPVAGRLDSVARATLGDETIGTAKLALRWLHDQALRVADGLDPEQVPGRPSDEKTDPGRLITPVTDPAGDVPAELRAWAGPAAQQFAREELTSTGRLCVTARDSSGRYWLAAQRVAAPAPLPTPASVPDFPHAYRRRQARHERRRRAVGGCGPP